MSGICSAFVVHLANKFGLNCCRQRIRGFGNGALYSLNLHLNKLELRYISLHDLLVLRLQYFFLVFLISKVLFSTFYMLSYTLPLTVSLSLILPTIVDSVLPSLLTPCSIIWTISSELYRLQNVLSVTAYRITFAKLLYFCMI